MNQRSSASLFNLLRRFPLITSTNPYSVCSKALSKFPAKLFSSPVTSIPYKPNSTCCNLNQLRIFILNFRSYSSQSEAVFDKNKIVDEINLKFAEAREEIESAMESKETVYFNEEAECARAAVKEVLDMFDGLLSKLDSNERDALRRSMGLKIEQLKAELQQLDE